MNDGERYLASVYGWKREPGVGQEWDTPAARPEGEKPGDTADAVPLVGAYIRAT